MAYVYKNMKAEKTFFGFIPEVRMKDKSVSRKCQINYSIKEYSTAKTTAERLRLWPVLKLMWSFTWNPFSFLFLVVLFIYILRA